MSTNNAPDDQSELDEAIFVSRCFGFFRVVVGGIFGALYVTGHGGPTGALLAVFGVASGIESLIWPQWWARRRLQRQRQRKLEQEQKLTQDGPRENWFERLFG